MRYWLHAANRQCHSLLDDATELPANRARPKLSEPQQLEQLEHRARALAMAMDFSFLYDESRSLFSIGWRVDDQVLDDSHYDLLASEARLASIVAIAKGDVPQRHWFKLGRSTTWRHGEPTLLSWSGSMFEYLMPELVMDVPEQSAIGRTDWLITAVQIDYGRAHGIPWGTSESAFNARDPQLNYQYQNFGVPGLGLKRGLDADLVIAPYATALAAMVRPRDAANNFIALQQWHGLGRYGFCEAIDFTAERRPSGQASVLVRAYMAHHQGMTVVALTNVLLDGLFRRRFHAEPIIRASEMLLEERPPLYSTPTRRKPDTPKSALPALARDPLAGGDYDPHLAAPFQHVLGRRDYAVQLTAAGAGTSRTWLGTLTRYRPDVTDESTGFFIYVQDVDSGVFWSTALQPVARPPDHYAVDFLEESVTYRRTDDSIDTTTQIVVSPEQPLELRQVRLRNRDRIPRTLELTSYAELVLGDERADAMHPAFANLFVQTEFDAQSQALLANRRTRADSEPARWLVHCLQTVNTSVQYETDRAAFVGRLHTVRAPAAMLNRASLANTTGAVLDPIIALRTRIRLQPGEEAVLGFMLGVASSREQALELCHRSRSPGTFERTLASAWTHSRILLRHLDIELAEARLFQDLASQCLLPDRSRVTPGGPSVALTTPLSALWRFAISGEQPIVILFVSDLTDEPFAWQMVRAQEYWRGKQIAIDVVMINDRPNSYREELQSLLERVVRAAQATAGASQALPLGNLVAVRSDQVSAAERALLLASAQVILNAAEGSLSEQIRRLRARAIPVSTVFEPVSQALRSRELVVPQHALAFWNGQGGFDQAAHEYVIAQRDTAVTPAPWVNVIANEGFGSVVSASGSAFTWFGNSREFQLTPWSNDPVTEASAEACFIRDEQSLRFWSPTMVPVAVPGATYITRHGHGYSRFEVECEDIHTEYSQWVHRRETVKVIRLQLTNRSASSRRLTVTQYVQWLLGSVSHGAAAPIVTEWNAAAQALVARNPVHTDYGDAVAFIALREPCSGYTADRQEFVGRNGSLATPAAICSQTPLARRVGAHLDSCGAVRAGFEIDAGATVEIVAYLGACKSSAQLPPLLALLRAQSIDQIKAQIGDYWQSLLNQITISTPDQALNALVNRWLPYQVISCRLWGRAGFSQAGGAFGFRDQLQDALNVSMLDPQLLRAQLLRSAAHQFAEGDVQHWWHPPGDRGVRTRCSDDLVWLPYAIAHYVNRFGDIAVLDTPIAFLEGPQLRDDQVDHYFVPGRSQARSGLYEHGARALDARLAVGGHGLPLIGSGDWNDGMSDVGIAGRGESVWLAWFLIVTLRQYAALAELRQDAARAERWRHHANALNDAVESNGWDGDWYRRAYFDDGSPIGSAQSKEAQIDSIAQSWAVLSGAGRADRAQRALESVRERLVKSDASLILLLTPPFNVEQPSPGYIRGYIPGVRENGGQYTQAAIWYAMACAQHGDADNAARALQMINPISHSSDAAGVARYRAEPYVIAADVYGQAPHLGRGGWSWYTGSAGWMYRATIESLLGVILRLNRLYLAPKLPSTWPGFDVRLVHRGTRFDIAVRRDVSQLGICFDGEPLSSPQDGIALPEDGLDHQITLSVA